MAKESSESSLSASGAVWPATGGPNDKAHRDDLRAQGADSNPALALRLVSVSKVYRSTGVAVAALGGVDLSLAPGTFTAVMGPSGSGKSTLLHCASGLDEPTSGQVFIAGTQMTFGSETELTKFRRGRIGFVFQQFNLLPTLTVLQNVVLPLRLAGMQIDRTAT